AVKAEESSSGVVDYAFQGDRWTRESNLYHLSARDYASKFMRFTSADSIIPDPLDPQSYNRYSYVGNNPTNYIDPSGHIRMMKLDAETYAPTGGGGGIPTGKGFGGFGGYGGTDEMDARGWWTEHYGSDPLDASYENYSDAYESQQAYFPDWARAGVTQGMK